MLQPALLIWTLFGWFALNLVLCAWLFLRPPRHFGEAMDSAWRRWKHGPTRPLAPPRKCALDLLSSCAIPIS